MQKKAQVLLDKYRNQLRSAHQLNDANELNGIFALNIYKYI